MRVHEYPAAYARRAYYGILMRLLVMLIKVINITGQMTLSGLC